MQRAEAEGLKLEKRTLPETHIRKCVVHWKSYYERFHFDPLKCIAGLMYNVERIGVWKYEAKMSRDWPPPSPEVLRVSTYSPGMRGI